MAEYPMTISLELPCNFRYLSIPRCIARNICSEFESRKKDENLLWAVELAISEAVTNAMKYGCGEEEKENVLIDFAVWPDRLEVKITDWGKEFDWDKIKEPDFVSPKERGYGVYIIKELMDVVEYSREGSRNILKLVKYFA